MFQEENVWYKKSFASNTNNSRINKILYNVKLEAQELVMIKKGLDFTFSIV